MDAHRDSQRKSGEASFRGFPRPAGGQHRTQLSDKTQVQSAQPRAPSHNLACFEGRPHHQLQGTSFSQSKPGLRSLANRNNPAPEQPRLHQLNLRLPPCDQKNSSTSHALPGQSQNDRAPLTARSLNPTLSRVGKVHQTGSESSRGGGEMRKNATAATKRQLISETNREESEEPFFEEDPSEANMSELDIGNNSEYDESLSRSPQPADTTANFPQGRAKSTNFIQSRSLNVPAADSRETTATKRSCPSWKSGSRKRRFVSPSNCHPLQYSTIDEDTTSVNVLLGAVGKRNKSLEDELNKSVRENQILRQKIGVTEKEKVESRERLKKLASRISAEKKNLDESFGEMKFQVRERLTMEKRQAEDSSKEVGALRVEIRESLEAFRNLYATSSDIQDETLITPNQLGCANLQNSRKVVNIIKEIDEDRNKKQLVIDMFRKELELRSGQVTEMSQRILDLENLNSTQLIKVTQAEETWGQESRSIQQTVEKRTERILSRLDENNCFKEEEFRSRIKVLEDQVLAKDQAVLEMSKELGISQLRLQDVQKSLSIEVQNNSNKKEESLKLSIDLSLVEKKRTFLEMLTSKLVKEKVNEQETKSKISVENIRLKNENKTLSEDLVFHENLLTQAHQNIECLNLRLEDQDLIIGGLRSFESTHESIKMELVATNGKIRQLQEENSALETEKSCTHLHASECHLKIKMLESNKEEMMRTSIQDSHAVTRLNDRNSQLKVQIQILENDLTSTKEEYSIAQQKISLKGEELVKISGCERQLKEKVGNLLESIANRENINKELQTRLDVVQSKYEEQRGREDVVNGQINILRENLAEAQDNQNSSIHEMEKLRRQVTDLSVKNSELEMIGESRCSRERIEGLVEQLKQEVQKRDEFDKLLKERCENEVTIKNFHEEVKHQATLLVDSERERDSLLDKLKTTQHELQRSQTEMDVLKTSHALQLTAATSALQETEKQASESRKQAASTAREKAVVAMEHKYELKLMNADNEKKRLANRLSDSESRLLAMSAELAKLKGKPSLEEIFSSSEHNEQVLIRPLAKKCSETIHGSRGSDFIQAEHHEQRAVPDEELNQDHHRVFNRDMHKKLNKVQQVPRESRVVAATKKEDQELQVVVPRSSERAAISTTRMTRKPGVRKKNAKRST